jgi:hypothetical protein
MTSRNGLSSPVHSHHDGDTSCDDTNVHVQRPVRTTHPCVVSRGQCGTGDCVPVMGRLFAPDDALTDLRDSLLAMPFCLPDISDNDSFYSASDNDDESARPVRDEGYMATTRATLTTTTTPTTTSTVLADHIIDPHATAENSSATTAESSPLLPRQRPIPPPLDNTALTTDQDLCDDDDDELSRRYYCREDGPPGGVVSVDVRVIAALKEAVKRRDCRMSQRAFSATLRAGVF